MKSSSSISRQMKWPTWLIVVYSYVVRLGFSNLLHYITETQTWSSPFTAALLVYTNPLCEYTHWRVKGRTSVANVEVNCIWRLRLGSDFTQLCVFFITHISICQTEMKNRFISGEFHLSSYFSVTSTFNDLKIEESGDRWSNHFNITHMYVCNFLSSQSSAVLLKLWILTQNMKPWLFNKTKTQF